MNKTIFPFKRDPNFQAWIKIYHDVVHELRTTTHFSGSLSRAVLEKNGGDGLLDLAEHLTDEFFQEKIKFVGDQEKDKAELDRFLSSKFNQHFNETHR